ncbi:hypothetical protein LMG31886_16100 [Xanthomonas hydrangeae]|nr:hypothetical protein LMG31884_17090 [Xanthomonas hydrangeae]CAD7715587.1 hypothetical protein LMG31884_17090 [Xanthomonas hydrangeae]CAD7728376.1 hypothetical protein LMG31887_17080 [Xanthomonas hydrangeae]CAD7728380.1 hypothetical protein LMG31887_17080 [Xanthomonas hydrangeae]CAD7731766.1 hypothetical protein LMG31886_16100 [Xanthomonas hydrangeae]
MLGVHGREQYTPRDCPMTEDPISYLKNFASHSSRLNRHRFQRRFQLRA